VTILRKKFSPPIEVAARRDGGIEVYDIGNNATLAGYANTAKIPVPAAGWGMAAQEIDGLGDPLVTDEERRPRKQRLIKGPKEFRDIRSNRVKIKG